MAPPPVASRNITPHIRLNSNPTNILADPTDSLRPQSWVPPPRRAASPRGNPANALRPDELRSLRQTTSSESLNLSPPPDAGASLLTPPVRSRSRTRAYRDISPTPSVFSSSRHSSIDSDISADSRQGLYRASSSPDESRSPSPDESRSPSMMGSEDELINTQTVSRKFNISPYAGLIMYPEDVEKDDYLHNPDGLDGRDCDIWTKRGLLNVGSLILITMGVLTLFIGYPVISYLQRQINPTGTACAQNKDCISANLPLLKNIRTGLIDPSTPASVRTRKATDGSTQTLVFSDEFNTDNRTFYGGDDAYFQAVDLWYGGTLDLEWYDPDAITTKDGTLQIRFDAFKNHGLNYRSGMLQSWNQMCFKGGHMEASISLPGRGDTIGFWPGFWAMGNLGRPGYASTTDGLWPYSYHDVCDFGITKNQSSPDGLSHLPGMRLPACTCPQADHPNRGKSRSAPEIDVLEASVGYLDPPDKAAIGTVSQSAQFAPFDIWYQPNYDFVEIYDDSITSMNNYRGGFYQQALSGLTNLNNTWYDGVAYQKYGFEYEPGATGHTTWFVGDDATWKLDARAMGPNGNIGQRVIPQEPMAMVVNFGMSNNFADINMTGIATLLPATMRIDYIRIYQGDDDYIGCDPPDYPTTEYISQHPRAYLDREKTLWSETGYGWPKNSFVDGCT